jgi:UDP-2,3-diacylglucosamine pyrophosphatase LpxH
VDVRVDAILKNLPDDTDLETVCDVFRGGAGEWLDMDHHPQDMIVTASTAMTATINVNPVWTLTSARRAGPIYAISDLHMGDGGPRDNFAFGGREKALLSFLDFVDANDGRLIICGDLFELWQSNISKVLTQRERLLDRLAAMGAIYVLGNHDADLKHFIRRPGWLEHPFFSGMCLACLKPVAGKLFVFCHGHEVDPYCTSDTPGIGRITAIYSGLAEDKNGSPMLDKYRTVEDKVVGRLEWLVSLWNRLRGKPDRFTEMNRKLQEWAKSFAYNNEDAVAVTGHTHKPGRIGDWHYNCGTWAERVNSFVCINDNGTAGVFNWVYGRRVQGQAVPNMTELSI